MSVHCGGTEQTVLSSTRSKTRLPARLPEPAGAHDMRNAKRIRGVGLVALRRHRRADMLGHGRPYNIDRLTFEWGSIIVRGSLCGRSKHRRHRDRRVS